ncbi:MAG: radical SAM protein [Acidobacteriota bacterium]
MAGTRTGEFRELISPFLLRKMEEARSTFGVSSGQSRALTLQYVKSEQETIIREEERRRHYEAEVQISFERAPVVGVERLYRRTILVEPTTVCAAHCRWCLRGQYPVQTLTEAQIRHATRYMGSPAVRDDLDEVLITGGDPLMSLPILAFTLSELARNAPNIQTVRVGTRVPFQAPERISDDLLATFRRYKEFRFEIGVNVNHPVEFWPESVESLRRLRDVGIRLYNQHPLLKGVNDDLQTLTELYSLLRRHDIEAHYLFHAIPLRGMSHHRTSLARGARLAAALGSCGEFSGRAKPRYAVLSDVGKIVIYHGVVLERREIDNALLLQSAFRLEDRLRWNPAWQVPPDVAVDDEGYMRTWYLDGRDDGEDEPEGGDVEVTDVNAPSGQSGP